MRSTASSIGRSIFSITCYPDFATSGHVIINYHGDNSRLPVPGPGETVHDVIPNLDKDGSPDPSYTTELRVSRFTLSQAHLDDVVANGLSGAKADRARAALWLAVDDSGELAAA